MKDERDSLADKPRMSPKWVERAAFVASLLPEGLAIVDIGCGAMHLERLARPRRYTPIDRHVWDDRTRVIDLSRKPIPAEWLEGCELAALLGVLEYLADPRPLLSAVAAANCAVAVSYTPTDTGQSVAAREVFKSHLTTAEFEAMLAEAGLQIARKFNYGAVQRIYLCHPVGRAPEWLAEPSDFRSVAADQKPTLVVAGFYARGNCGDEALLQCIYEAMQPHFDVLISLDEHGAYPGYWDWYPYNQLPRTHQTNLGFSKWSKQLAGLLVGGGGLPYGFGANQAVQARLAGAATALAGVDFTPRTGARGGTGQDAERAMAAIRQYAELFDFRAPRTESAVTSAAQVGLQYFHGGDWALKLPTDTDSSVEKNDRRALLVLRETAPKFVAYEFGQEIEQLIAALEQRGYEPQFLPFSPEDERFLAQIGLQHRIPVIRSWWNPRRAKQWIASSGLVLSLGRLHPLIFAATTGVPVAGILGSRRILLKKDPLVDLAKRKSKLANFSRELGIQLFRTVDETIAGLDTVGPADAERVALSLFRVDNMTKRLHRLFLEDAARRAEFVG